MFNIIWNGRKCHCHLLYLNSLMSSFNNLIGPNKIPVLKISESSEAVEVALSINDNGACHDNVIFNMN